ncbi:hypothetical protein HMPREF0530_0902 [Lacticaseibacillus paracasei subsp. paracasei ATCC 25302 = DSM 5622 = JCM 8130]|nr:hypothetical protein HMPREF0530_0902 [Lacticaseibacillus paracasei subsp. paracasei ATCC 25302 = DSM 5622 = JCM 8130]
MNSCKAKEHFNLNEEEKEMKQFDEQKMVNMSDEELLGFIGGDSIRDVSPTFNKIRRWFDGLFK